MRRLTRGSLLALVLVTFSALAAEVDEAMARTAIGRWRARNGTLGVRLGPHVREVRRVSGRNVSFHVLRFGGGASQTRTFSISAPVTAKQTFRAEFPSGLVPGGRSARRYSSRC